MHTHLAHIQFNVRPTNLSFYRELWQRLLQRIPHDPTFAIIDSFPLPACPFARASRCRRFRGEAAFGTDTLVRQTFYGFRVHVRLAWPGVITRFCVAPANAHELAVLPALAEQTSGMLVGDRTSWSPVTTAEWQAHGALAGGALSQRQARSAPALERAAESRALSH